MALHTPNPSPYQVGGSLQREASTYVRRQADIDLFEGLIGERLAGDGRAGEGRLPGEFCYALNSRQMGKSSLRVRVMAQLQRAGVACVAIQMTDIIDEETTPEQFYAGVIDSIATDLDLAVDPMAWWSAQGELSLVNRFSKFLETVLLQEVTSRVVIFIDEIDRILSLPFKVNGFFAAIRECYNKRADHPDFRRLTFALLGVATPSDLIEDKQSTPFNVGRAIELTGFSEAEAQPLAAGLAAGLVAASGTGLGGTQPDQVLRAILHWSGGQPFLTQKLCQLVAQAEAPALEDEAAAQDWVSRLVQARILHNWQAQDEPEHLRTIRDRLLRDEQKAARRLGLYQQILAAGHIPAQGANSDHMELRLSGLVVERQGQLAVYNPVYRAIFDEAWTAQALANLRPYARAIEAWLAADRKATSRLLRGAALSEAKDWSADKVLPPEDYAFLAASQELATAEAEQAKVTLAVANQTLEDANREATARIATANRRLKIGSGILLGTIALAVLAGGSALQINSLAREQQSQAKQDIAAAQAELAQAQQASAQANADKEAADQAKDAAQAGLAKARADSEQIRQDSEAQIAQAASRVAQAADQAQAAQSATEQAQQAQQKAAQAQRSAQAAQSLATQAQTQATLAQAESAAAQAEQTRAQAGTRLERLGIALLRRPTVQMTGLDTLLDALDLGEQLRALLPPTGESPLLAQGKVQATTDYPALSPLLALRTAVNSVLAKTKVEGEFSGFSDDGQTLGTSLADQDISRIYDLQGQLLAEYAGTVDRYGTLGFTADGNHLLTRTNDGFFHLWQLDDGLDDLLARGCDWVRPYLQANPQETRARFCLEASFVPSNPR